MPLKLLISMPSPPREQNSLPSSDALARSGGHKAGVGLEGAGHLGDLPGVPLHQLGYLLPSTKSSSSLKISVADPDPFHFRYPDTDPVSKKISQKVRGSATESSSIIYLDL